MTLFEKTFKGRRVLVTGHTGFKGSWLTAWLLMLGADVCGYAKDIPSNPSLFEDAGLAKKIRHEIGDVRDAVRLTEVVKSYRPDFVFHLAAQAIVSESYANPLDTITTNVVGTACVLEALRSVDWPCAAVLVSSDKAYENVEWAWGYRENDRLGGKDVYSGSKGAAEIIFHAYQHSFFKDDKGAVRLATARAGNVIGGGDWAADRVVADCIRSWQKGQPVSIRRPNATRPWQHVLEPLSGYLLLAARLVTEAALHGESFNFGPRTEQNMTVLALLQNLAKEWGADLAEPCRIIEQPPFYEAGFLKVNCDKALAHLRWEANLSYAECVQMTGSWYRRVLRDKADALDLTMEQIAAYESFADQRRRVWRAAVVVP